MIDFLLIAKTFLQFDHRNQYFFDLLKLAPKSPKIYVGMSGGVDSSVVALILKSIGFDPIGLFMKNWEDDGICTSAQDAQDVESVCAQLNIPFFSLNFVEEYQKKVFSYFLEDLKNGLTPNPDMLCNREIKFQCFLKEALELNADFLATGHYAGLTPKQSHQQYPFQLSKAVDLTKDQSYFLAEVDPKVWKNVLFPLMYLKKSQVRLLAEMSNLVVSKKKDSTGICFVGERNFTDFLQKYISESKGSFVDLDGNQKGPHNGHFNYTIGQRKGLGIGGPGEPWFVAGKNILTNDVLVVQGENHPALFYHDFSIHVPHWQIEAAEIESLWQEVQADLVDKDLIYKINCLVKIRYRQEDIPCELIKKFNHDSSRFDYIVSFPEAIRAPTPGQYAVFYLNQQVIACAVISELGHSNWAKSCK